MKKALTITLFSAVALTMFATQASATTKDDKTDVGISFKPGGGPVPGDHKPYKDNLSIVWKPGLFDFGEQKAVGGTAVFNNVEPARDRDTLTVNDDRADSKFPWRVTAKMSKLVDVKDPAIALSAKVTFSLGALQAYKITDTPDQLDKDNDYANVNKPEGAALSELKEPSIALAGNSITLTAGDTESVKIVEKTGNAEFRNGVNTKISDAKLSITDMKVAETAGKNFSSQIIWTLDDAPK